QRLHRILMAFVNREKCSNIALHVLIVVLRLGRDMNIAKTIRAVQVFDDALIPRGERFAVSAAAKFKRLWQNRHSLTNGLLIEILVAADRQKHKAMPFSRLHLVFDLGLAVIPFFLLEINLDIEVAALLKIFAQVDDAFGKQVGIDGALFEDREIIT